MLLIFSFGKVCKVLFLLSANLLPGLFVAFLDGTCFIISDPLRKLSWSDQNTL